MDSSKIKALIIVVLALCFALYLGITAATAQLEAIAWVGGGIFVVICLLLGRNIWILLPAFAVCEGFFNVLPGSPEPWIFAGMVIAGMYAIRLLSKREGFVWRWSLLDAAVLLHVIWLVGVWMRNPSGFMIMGGDGGGGKAYLLHMAAVGGYACLSVTNPTVSAVKFAGILRIVTGLFDGMIHLLQGVSTNFAALGLRSYTSPMFTETSLGKDIDLSESRLVGGRYLAYNLLTPAFCLVRPIRCLIPVYILPFLATVAGAGLILLSGFRSGIAYFVVLFIVASFVRRKPLDAVICCALGSLALVLVIASGQVDKMPFGVQRALIPLGVNVKSEAVLQSAERSSGDRFEMWEMVLTQEGYIRNKLLGDGFALSRAEHNALIDSQLGLNHMSFIDRSLATGNYHGFHVATIKYTGYVGLFIAIFMMSVAFKTSLKLIKAYRHTELFPYVLYFCLPLMLYLPWSLLVFGEYKAEFAKFIIMAGMVKLLENLMLQKPFEARSSPVDRMLNEPGIPARQGLATARSLTPG
jgi:hypothetical protein